MKPILYFLFLLPVLLSCKEVEPKETQATILYYADSFTGCDAGFKIIVGENPYTTYDITAPFDDLSKFPRKVWIRYEIAVKTQTDICNSTSINVKSIRDR